MLIFRPYLQSFFTYDDDYYVDGDNDIDFDHSHYLFELMKLAALLPRLQGRLSAL